LDDFTLSIQYVRQIGDLLGGMGADVPGWLCRCGLDEAALADRNRTIAYPAFHRLISEALKITGEPALGLLVGQTLRVTSHGMLGFAAMNSSTLRQAIGLLEGFLALRFTLVGAHHEVLDQQVRLHFQTARPLGAIHVPVLEAVILTITKLLGHMTRGACPVIFVSFAHSEPSYAALARDLFECEVRYAQRWNGFSIPLEAIDRPLSTADPASFEEAARICRLELEKRAAGVSMSGRVRRALLEKQGRFPSLQVAARLFNMTPRTLHRRLVEEGTSFQAILEEVRHTLAVQYLRYGNLSIQEIAFDLGYSDQANFRRAFKRWENATPSDYVRAIGRLDPGGVL
jgi:AraC-like DNA-binding protein